MGNYVYFEMKKEHKELEKYSLCVMMIDVALNDIEMTFKSF